MTNSWRQPDRLGRIGAWSLSVATLAVLLVTLLGGFSPVLKAKAGWATSAQGAYAPGEIIDLPPRLYESNTRTVVVFASATCGASVRSTPQIASLASSLRETKTKVLVVTPDTMKADQQSFVSSLQLEPSESVALALGGLRLKNVPTFVLIDGHGRVLHVHEGVLNDAGRDTLLREAAGGRL